MTHRSIASCALVLRLISRLLRRRALHAQKWRRPLRFPERPRARRRADSAALSLRPSPGRRRWHPCPCVGDRPRGTRTRRRSAARSNHWWQAFSASRRSPCVHAYGDRTSRLTCTRLLFSSGRRARRRE